MDQRHWDIVVANLRVAFPEHDEAWVQAMARACFAHLGQVILELPRLVRLSPQAILERTRHHGLDNLETARALGKGVLMLSGHIGNWEWAYVVSGIIVGGAYGVARPLDWPPAEELVTFGAPCATPWCSRLAPLGRCCAFLRAMAWLGCCWTRTWTGMTASGWISSGGWPVPTRAWRCWRWPLTPVLTYHNFRAPDGSFDSYFGPQLPLIKSGYKVRTFGKIHKFTPRLWRRSSASARSSGFGCTSAGRPNLPSLAPGAKTMTSLRSSQPERILLRGTNWVGDAVMTLPACTALAQACPQAQIEVLVKPWVAAVYQASPAVSRVIVLDDQGVHAGLGGLWRLSQELKERRYDWALLWQNAFQAALIAWLAKVPVRLGYDTDARRLLLSHPVPRAPGAHPARDSLLSAYTGRGGTLREEPHRCAANIAAAPPRPGLG
ncbi:hypothetical protein DFAR_3610028 [Desulfarculales bacterium]